MQTANPGGGYYGVLGDAAGGVVAGAVELFPPEARRLNVLRTMCGRMLRIFLCSFIIGPSSLDWLVLLAALCPWLAGTVMARDVNTISELAANAIRLIIKYVSLNETNEYSICKARYTNYNGN